MRARGARLRLATTAVATIVLALCTASAASASVTVSQSGWAWGNPSPQGNTLNAISFAGPLGYAVGDNGTALKTHDGGATWSGLATGTAGELTRVQIVDANTVVVGGGNGCILRISTDGGAVFTKIFTVAEANCHDQVQAFSFVSAAGRLPAAAQTARYSPRRMAATPSRARPACREQRHRAVAAATSASRSTSRARPKGSCSRDRRAAGRAPSSRRVTAASRGRRWRCRRRT